MKLIQENPYRIVGILSNATAKEIQTRKGKITAYAKVGKQVSSEYDFPFLNPIEKDHKSIEKAFSSIQQSKEMLDNSLFWFLKTNSFDETALTYLINGDKDKAIEIWEKVTHEKEVTSKNYSSFNNVGTLKLLGATSVEIKQGIEAKLKLIESSFFKNFVHAVAGEAFIIDNQKESEFFVNVLLSQLNGKFSNSEIITLFENCNNNIKNFLIEKFTEEPFHKIESAIESTKRRRNLSNIDSYEYGFQLYNECKSNLEQLKSLLGVNDLKYKLIADNLAKEILQCGIDYFNKSQETDSTENYLEYAIRLNKIAFSIAVGKLVKDRVKDNLETLENMKDRELNRAILILSTVKSAYEKAISEIDDQVSQARRSLSYNQTINLSKVEKMKAECLNWDKVVELVCNEISSSDVEVIQRCPNQSKISEYKNLVDFLIPKLAPKQKKQVKYICYWKEIIVNQPTDGCYIATMAYGDYDHPQVIELRKFRDDFLRKTFLGRCFIRLYYQYSPILVQKLNKKPKINQLIRSGLDQLIKTIKY